MHIAATETMEEFFVCQHELEKQRYHPHSLRFKKFLCESGNATLYVKSHNRASDLKTSARAVIP